MLNVPVLQLIQALGAAAQGAKRWKTYDHPSDLEMEIHEMDPNGLNELQWIEELYKRFDSLGKQATPYRGYLQPGETEPHEGKLYRWQIRKARPTS